jgi:hypothetical protein
MTTTTKKKKKRPSCVERAEWAEEPKAAVKITLTANRTFSPFSYLFLFFFCLSLSLISRLKPRKWETTLGVPKRSNKH